VAAAVVDGISAGDAKDSLDAIHNRYTNHIDAGRNEEVARDFAAAAFE